MEFKEESQKLLLEPIQKWVGENKEARVCLMIAAEVLNGNCQMVANLPKNVYVFSYIMAKMLDKSINDAQAAHFRELLNSLLLRVVENSDNMVFVSLFSVELVQKINERFKKNLDCMKEGESFGK